MFWFYQWPEAGISKDGQTQNHMIEAFTMGVRKAIVCINKMDAIEYSESRYLQVKQEVSEIMKKVGYQVSAIDFVPVSGLKGDNLAELSSNMKWYSGPTLLQAIDKT